jgi:phytoene synthase
MTLEEALALCEATVRSSDPDRYFATLFAPSDKRPLLYALYAFNCELARIADVAREPMMAEIRLQWWREALEGACEGRSRVHPASIGLAEIFACASPPRELFERLIDARAPNSISAPFAHLEALDAYADASSASLMRIAAHILDMWADVDIPAREAGMAYGLARILHAIPQCVARGKMPLPADLLVAEGLSVADLFSARDFVALKRAIARVSDVAQTHLARARDMQIPRETRAAFLPASLVPAYLSQIARSSNPLRDRHEISQVRRQLILLRSALLGHL